MLKLIDLRTEYATKPLAVSTSRPRFSWRHETDLSCFIQTSYHIYVATSPELLDKPDLWDSGDRISNRQLSVEYCGAPLLGRKTYYWKCMVSGKGLLVKDKNKSWEICELQQLSERENEKQVTCESEIETFETAIFDLNDWRGVWISTPISSVGSALCFRKGFDIPKGKIVSRARAYVCGIGYHEFYINGNKIGNAVLEPGTTDYSKRIYYCTYAFSLTEGENTLGVLVGNGWYGNRKLLLQMYVEFSDGTELEIHSANCAGWWATGSAIISNSIYDGEIYDARRERQLEGWATKDYVPGWNNGWMYTYLVEKPSGKLEAQAVEPIRVVSEIKPVSYKSLTKKCFVYDFGQIFAGWVKIRVRGSTGAKISLKYAEGVNSDGTVNQLNLRSAKCRDLYILRGDLLEECYAPRFTYHGFGFVQVEMEGEVDLIEIIGQYVRSSMECMGDFSCSSDILNQLHRNAVITEGSNLHSIMTDCPQRDERLGWLNDITSRIYQSECNYAMERFFPKFLNDISDTQDERGAIADTAPFYTGGRPADPVSICFLLLGLHCYHNYGDRRVLEEHFEGYQKWFDILAEMADENHILRYSPYGDWCPPGNFMPEDPPFNKDAPGALISTAYYFWHAICMQEISEILEKNDWANKYRARAEQIRKSFQTAFLREDGCGYGTNSQSCNAIALNLGLVDAEHVKSVSKSLCDNLVEKGYHSTTGNQAYRHMIEALTNVGFAEEVFLMLVNPTYPGWGYMLAKGATTIWERWEDEMQNTMHSFCHPMFASFDAWFYHHLAGVDFAADDVGRKHIVFAPILLKELTACTCTLKTLRGVISAKWERVENAVRYCLAVPPNCWATVKLIGQKSFDIGSGNYQFSIRMPSQL